MPFPNLDDNLNIIQALADRPNALDGLSAAQLKQRFDQAGNTIKDFINNELIPALGLTTDGNSGADNIGATAITDLDGETVQTLLESVRSKLKSTTDNSSGADFVGATSIAGLSGTTVQSLLEALKGYVDAQGTSIGDNYVSKAELTNTRKLDATANFTGSWFGITNPAYADPGIAGVVASHTAQLADTGINVKTFGAVGNGVTDDTVALNRLNEYPPGSTIRIPDGTYKISGSIEIENDRVKVILSKGAKIYIVGAVSAIKITGEYCEVSGGEIYSDGPTVGNGVYGINIEGNYAKVSDCYIHDIAYTAVMAHASYCLVTNVIAERCGWDLASNYGAGNGYNTWVDCKAFLCGRHGFSTDSGTHHITFENCYAEDIGNPLLAEGHSSYHFEYSDYGRVINSAVKYTENHPICITANIGYNILGVRNEGSKSILVDGLDIDVDSGFSPVGGSNSLWWHYVDAGEETTVQNGNYNNESAHIVRIYLGNSTMRLLGNKILGLWTVRQNNANGTIVLLQDNNIIGDISLSFYVSRFSTNPVTATKNSFLNVKYGFEGHFIGGYFGNNSFKNSQGSILFSQYEGNSANKSTRNVVERNILDTLVEGLTMGWQGNLGFVRNNIFKGTMNTVLKGNSGGQQSTWTDNIKDASLSYTTLTDATATVIDTNLRSKDEKTTIIPLYAGGVGGYLWVDASAKVRFKVTLPTSDTDGIILGTQT